MAAEPTHHLSERLPLEAGNGIHDGCPGRWVWVIFGLAMLVMIVLSAPLSLDFKLFAFYDPGAAIKADWLVTPAGGRRIPTVDFAYSYGLFSLELGRVWFALLGRSPWAYWLFGVIGMLASAAGLVRLGRALSFAAIQWIILLASLPLAIPAYYLSLTHAAETPLILHALADHSRGKRARALLLVTIAAMFKPSMAYVYGLILLVSIGRDAIIACRDSAGKIRDSFDTDRDAIDKGRDTIDTGRDASGPCRDNLSSPADNRATMHRISRINLPRAIHRMLDQVWPAAVVGIIYCAISAAWFGWLPLVHTLFPLAAHESYRAAGFGFFTGAGRDFWILNDPWKYLFSPVGWWILGTAGMIFAAMVVICRGLRARQVSHGPILLTLTLLHIVFIYFFYAWAGSWVYYSFLPAIGLAAAWPLLPARRWMIVPLLGLIVCGNGSRIDMTRNEWRYKSRQTDAGNLWIYGDQLAMLNDCRQQAAGQPTYWLVNGYIGQMFEGIDTPPSWWLSPALQTPAEIAAIRDGIARSQLVVRWAEHGKLDPWLNPQLSDLTRDFAPAYRNDWFIVEKRKSDQ